MGEFDLARTVARDAARDAARLCLAIRRTMLNTPDQMEKAGREPVTIADYGAQAVVLRALSNHFPEDVLIAEERADDFTRLASEAQQNAVIVHVSEIAQMTVTLDDIRRWLDHGHGRIGDRVWVVDPIDGTKGFLRGEQFAIAVGLLVNGDPVIGALACPLLPVDHDKPDGPRGVIATAIRGRGAWIEPLDDGETRPLRVSAIHEAKAARMVESVDAGHTDHEFSANVLGRVRIGGQSVRMDSQAKYVAVADGRAELYIRHSKGDEYREKVWDHAAGVLIVQEAGGQVTDLRGKPLNFGCGATLAENHGILATNGPLHEILLDAIRTTGQH